MKKVIIIGAGASGLMAAIAALRAGSRVVLIEKKDRVGTKILATGNGHCNFTNKFFSLDCYYNENSDFLKTAFNIFDNESTIKFFNSIGIHSREKYGYYYPYSMEASSVLNGLRNSIESEKVKIITGATVVNIINISDSWPVDIGDNVIRGDSVIIACGSNASTKIRLNDNIIALIKKLGICVNDFKPSLTYLKVKEDFIRIASGVRFPVSVALYSNNQEVSSEVGELQITSRGISGICIFQLSRYVSSKPHKSFTCKINFMPDYDVSEIENIIYRKLQINQNMTIEQVFNGILPKKLVLAIGKHVNFDINKPVSVQKNRLKEFIKTVNSCDLTVVGTGDISEAQCTKGGVSLNEIVPDTMESKKYKGLYFAGEVIDVDGKCGGYNLQWAWTSGYIAGINASGKLSENR